MSVGIPQERRPRNRRSIITAFIIAVYLALAMSSQSFAAVPEPLVIDNGFSRKSLLPFLEFFEDSDRSLTFETVLLPEHQNRFQPGGGTSSYGYHDSAFWFRFTVLNPTNHALKFLLEHRYPAIDTIDIFTPGEGSKGVWHSGDKIAFSRRPIPYRNTVVPITVPPGTRIVYFRIQTHGALAVPVMAWNPEAFSSHAAFSSALYWLFYGAMAATAVYCLVLFAATRVLTYAYLAVFITGSSLFSMVHSGIAFQFLWPGSPELANAAHPISGYIGVLGALLFTGSFLATRKNLPRLHRALTALVIGIVLLAGSVPMVPYGIATRVMVIVSGTSFFLMIVCGMILAAKGRRPAKFYVAAWAAMVGSAIILSLRSFGLLDSALLADACAPVSTAIMVFLLTFGLMDKLLRIQTEKQAALKSLEQSSRQYRLLADNVKDVIWTLDLSTLTLNYITPSVETMLGYTPEEARKFSFKEMLPEDSQVEAWNEVSRGLAKGRKNPDEYEDTHTLVLQCYNRNRDLIWTETTTSLLLDASGHPLELLGVTRDISERIEADKERQAMEARLIQSNKLEAIGTLAGGIAHDMNNILTAVMGYVEISLSEVSRESRIHYRLKRVIQACNRAKDLVNQILTFSRQDSQENQPVRMNLIVKEVLKLIRATVPATIRIRQSIPNEHYVVLADPTRIHQIIMNLCSNANHAMQERGGILTVSLERMTLDRESAERYIDLPAGRYIRLSVSDTGCGMEKDVLNRVFEPFFTTKPKGQGTGMGLSMVHGIVTNLEGTITAYSEPGSGSTFSVLLPEAQGLRESLPFNDCDDCFGTGTLLYVDDEQDITNMVQEMLPGLGYTVETYTVSKDALARFEAMPNRFDLVITDQTMPGLTGIDLARRLNGIRPDLPVILCTGFNTAITRDALDHVGIKALVMKPFSKNDLALTVRRVLDASRKSCLTETRPLV